MAGREQIMKLIQDLSYMIEDEIEGACDYAKWSLKLKDDKPQLAQTFYSLTVDELKHIDILHNEVVRIINDYRNAGNEVPPDMQAIYDYLHEKQIKKVHSIKLYLEEYKG